MFQIAAIEPTPNPVPHGLTAPHPMQVHEPIGCGWFESSRELVQGIKVIEHQGFDALSFDVPLSWQLAACC